MNKRLRKCDPYINGKVSKPSAGNYFIRKNPAIEKPFAKIAESNSKDVDRAVKAARKAFSSWSKVSASERAKTLLRIAETLQKNQKQLALINTLETGKPIRESNLVEIGVL